MKLHTSNEHELGREKQMSPLDDERSVQDGEALEPVPGNKRESDKAKLRQEPTIESYRGNCCKN
jgi:hypothetical protein